MDFDAMISIIDLCTFLKQREWKLLMKKQKLRSVCNCSLSNNILLLHSINVYLFFKMKLKMFVAHKLENILKIFLRLLFQRYYANNIE